MKQILFIICILLLVNASGVRAQDFSTGLAQLVEVKDTTAADGSVVCSSADGFVMCKSASAPQMYGVIVDNPAGFYDPPYTVQNGRYVMNSGMVAVRYQKGGELIKKGQMVTSTAEPGTVAKATTNGYVLGTAVADADTTNGKVMVAINIHPETNLANTRSNLIAILKESSSAPILAPLDSLRYLIAAMLIIASFIIGFIYFGRMANTGVEAIGRNPLATKQIQFNMFLHIGITILIVLAGMFLSYLVLLI